uniref:Uncharacterized protein n=1 Tax=Rhizophora mucronata TaxID=61149 RepID=A0A2P2NYN4_RHIMU
MIVWLSSFGGRTGILDIFGHCVFIMIAFQSVELYNLTSEQFALEVDCE